MRRDRELQRKITEKWMQVERTAKVRAVVAFMQGYAELAAERRETFVLSTGMKRDVEEYLYAPKGELPPFHTPAIQGVPITDSPSVGECEVGIMRRAYMTKHGATTPAQKGTP